MDITKLLENNRQWVQKKLATDASYFTELAKGQSPHTLFIGCSDSRIDVSGMLGVGPGDVFVHRNIANVVGVDDTSVNSVIHYAVVHLKVQHIVVCGHYQCGGVNAAMSMGELGPLESWIQPIRAHYLEHKNEIDQLSDPMDQHKKFVELNVLRQCENVKVNSDVQAAISKGALEVHGWVFDMNSGNIIDL